MAGLLLLLLTYVVAQDNRYGGTLGTPGAGIYSCLRYWGSYSLAIPGGSGAGDSTQVLPYHNSPLTSLSPLTSHLPPPSHPAPTAASDSPPPPSGDLLHHSLTSSTRLLSSSPPWRSTRSSADDKQTLCSSTYSSRLSMQLHTSSNLS